MNRFFLESISNYDKEILIEDENAFHISSVLKLKENELIVLCDNNLNDFICKIISVKKEEVIVEVIETKKNQCELGTKITLLQAMPKSDKMDYIIQKSVELGVYEIIPVITEFTISRPYKSIDKKFQRMNKISESAAKQSGRGMIPNVRQIVSFNESIKIIKNFSRSIVAYEKENTNTLKHYLRDFNKKDLAVFIGPEGGFSEKEISILKDNNVQTITLGNRILRTETASLVTIANIKYELEE